MAERIEDTIVAIATPLGQGGLGVVRLSGPAALSIASAIFNPLKDFSKISSHTLHHGWIHSSGTKIDEAVLGLFRTPHSYTGEDVVEISCHGSPVVLKEVVHLCEKNGARLARPGEFTERSYLNGKLDLAQAEAVADLISAGSTLARQAAAEQLRGVLSERIQSLRRSLIDLLAQMEANLDFVEEAIPNLSSDKLIDGLEKIREDMEDLLSTSLRGRLIREGIRVAIVGRPNVGKSSLFNGLLAQDRSIVTDVPGTTRDTIEERLEWESHAVVLTDTAGLRSAKDEVEKLGTDRTRRSLELADVVALVFDASEDLTAEDRAVLKEADNKKAVVVLNKCDKKQRILGDSFNKAPVVVAVSARTGQGLSELKNALLKMGDSSAKEKEEVPLLTNLRHVQKLESAKGKIQAALHSLNKKRSEESVSVDLQAALTDLSSITGEDAGEGILDSIFSRFCIGK